MSIADVLRSLMEATLIDGKPISENQLARETDVPQPTIHRVLVGESKDPKSNTLKKLASRWNITVAQLRREEPLPPHLMAAAEGGEQIQEASQGPRKGKEIKIRRSEEDLELLMKKRSDLPDWFPLEVYQRELSKRKWISEILVRCVFADLLNPASELAQQVAQEGIDIQEYDPLPLFRAAIVNKDCPFLYIRQFQDRVRPIRDLTAFGAIFLAAGLRDEPFNPAWEMAEKIYKEKERSALGGFRGGTEYSIDGDQFFHGFPIDALGGYPMVVDLNFNDQILFEAFKGWLAYIRKELGVKAPKLFGEAELRKWHEYQILAVFDLDLWRRLSGSKYLDGVIAKSLWPDDAEEGGLSDPVDMLRRTARRRVAEVINWKTWHCLYHQVELEEAIIKGMQEP